MLLYVALCYQRQSMVVHISWKKTQSANSRASALKLHGQSAIWISIVSQGDAKLTILAAVRNK